MSTNYTVSEDLKSGSREMFKVHFNPLGTGFDIQYLDGKRGYHLPHLPKLSQLVYAYNQAIKGVTIDGVLSEDGLVAKSPPSLIHSINIMW